MHDANGHGRRPAVARPEPTRPSTQEAGPSRIPWPPILYGAALFFAIALEQVLAPPWFGAPFADILFAIGWLVTAAGLLLVVRTALVMRKADTAIPAHHPARHLVTTGPFGLSRNPIYLGFTAIMLGLGLVTGNPWFIALGLFAAFMTTLLAIRPEERHLEARFGKRYRDYAKKVRRWV